VVLVNGHVVTVDARFLDRRSGGDCRRQVHAVGTSAAIRKLAGPNTNVIDLRGQTVIPG
jgi:predicted amidohydrolase YtcJ